MYSYTGEGQIGDMHYTKGNLALRDHVKNGRRVFLFEETSRAFVKFIDELIVFDSDFESIPDRNGNLRRGIRFFFHKVGVNLPNRYDLCANETLAAESTHKINYSIPDVTERRGLVTSRVGQGAYRKDIIHRWEYKCAVTGYEKLEVLIASHIVSWKNSTNSERLDVNNGILLSPVYDALFDRHLISFENSGKIILSDLIIDSAFHKIGVTGKEKIIGLSVENLRYLEKHRNLIFNRK